jgi:Na+/H+ antiporter NhaD/arsenite permease-like protein
MTIILVAIMLFVLNWEVLRSWWIIVGAMIMLWIPYVSVWKMLKQILQTLSASAYYIFLTHMIFIHLIVRALKIDSSLLNVITALIGGVVTWMVLQNSVTWILGLKDRNKLSKLKQFIR